MSNRFRPQDFLVDRIKSYRKAGRGPAWIQQRSKYRGLNWTIRNVSWVHDPLVRVYSEIHYLTSHAPDKVKKRWKQAGVRLNKRCLWCKAGINDRL